MGIKKILQFNIFNKNSTSKPNQSQDKKKSHFNFKAMKPLFMQNKIELTKKAQYKSKTNDCYESDNHHTIINERRTLKERMVNNLKMDDSDAQQLLSSIDKKVRFAVNEDGNVQTDIFYVDKIGSKHRKSNYKTKTPLPPFLEDIKHEITQLSLYDHFMNRNPLPNAVVVAIPFFEQLSSLSDSLQKKYIDLEILNDDLEDLGKSKKYNAEHAELLKKKQLLEKQIMKKESKAQTCIQILFFINAVQHYLSDPNVKKPIKIEQGIEKKFYHWIATRYKNDYKLMQLPKIKAYKTLIKEWKIMGGNWNIS